jgi:transmembrane sensor
MMSFCELSPGQQRQLCEAAIWRLRLERDPSLELSAQYVDWSRDAQNLRAREALDAALATISAMNTVPEILALRRRALLPRRSVAAWRHRLRIGISCAAAAVGAAMAVLGIGYLVSHTPTYYATHVGERRSVTLADGSRLSLDSDTQVSVYFGASSRSVHLDRGRSHFDVAHDVRRPFTVSAGAETVVAVGTSFDVERLPTAVLVTLIEGRVIVRHSGAKPRRAIAAGSEEPLSLHAGEQLIATPNLRPAVATADLRTELAWETGHLVFRDETLGNAVARVNRYTDRNILIDPAIADIRVSGVFNAGDVDSFVSAVTSYFPIQASVTGKNYILLQHRS